MMLLIIGVLVGLAVALTPAAVRIIRAHWPHRVTGEECEVCGGAASRVLTAVGEGDDALGISAMGGATMMSATYCRRHAPAGTSRL